MSESLESMYEHLKRKVFEQEKDFSKAGKGNKAAGIRVRTGMQELKKIADNIRKKILEIRNEKKET